MNKFIFNFAFLLNSTLKEIENYGLQAMIIAALAIIISFWAIFEYYKLYQNKKVIKETNYKDDKSINSRHKRFFIIFIIACLLLVYISVLLMKLLTVL